MDRPHCMESHTLDGSSSVEGCPSAVHCDTRCMWHAGVRVHGRVMRRASALAGAHGRGVGWVVLHVGFRPADMSARGLRSADARRSGLRRGVGRGRGGGRRRALACDGQSGSSLLAESGGVARRPAGRLLVAAWWAADGRHSWGRPWALFRSEISRGRGARGVRRPAVASGERRAAACGSRRRRARADRLARMSRRVRRGVGTGLPSRGKRLQGVVLRRLLRGGPAVPAQRARFAGSLSGVKVVVLGRSLAAGGDARCAVLEVARRAAGVGGRLVG